MSFIKVDKKCKVIKLGGEVNLLNFLVIVDTIDPSDMEDWVIEATEKSRSRFEGELTITT